MQAPAVKRVVISLIGGSALVVAMVSNVVTADMATGTIDAQLVAQRCVPSRLDAAIAYLDYLLHYEVAASEDRIEYVKGHIAYLLLDEVIAGRDGAVGSSANQADCQQM
jgi:hypothetical protein